MSVRRKLASVLLVTAGFAQSPAPLPPNYKVILDNADVLVQRVHYGPHEFVPMHDHPAAATVYIYLNHSGVVDITHEGPSGLTVHRPPTQTGAFRISPGMFERHSVQNQSDLPSDFLRVELKRVPVNSLPAEFRGEAPKEPFQSSTETLYDNAALRVERILCAPVEKCNLLSDNAPSLLVVVPFHSTSEPKQTPIIWLPANKDLLGTKEHKAFDSVVEGEDEPWEILRIVLPKH
jgi:hypothetical protein